MTTVHADVLLVEDDSADAELILASLGDDTMSERVHVAPDGQDALDWVFCRGGYAGRPTDAPPRVIILDVKVTKVGGLDVLRQLKRDPRTSAIPVVMLSSSNLFPDVEAGYRLGANSYVQKPVDFDQFRATVRQLGVYWLTVNEPPHFSSSPRSSRE
jgi:two-component system, response regulator